jgi:hypothetical protein
MAPFEFLSVLGSGDTGRVFVRDLDQCWYQRGVRGLSTDLAGTTAALRGVVDAAAPGRVVTVGTSAGGFAAMYFGCELGADLALAFGPQTFTSRRLRAWHRDRRWVEEIRAIDALDPRRVCRDVAPVVRRSARSARPTRVEVHYGGRIRIDRVHARRLRRASNVALYEHDGGHNIAKVLRDREELDPILSRALLGHSPGQHAGDDR